MSRCLSVVIPVYNERATFEELLRRVLADRHVVGFPFTEDLDRLIASLDRNGVTHVVVDGLFQETHRYLLPALRRHADRFEPEAQVFSPAFVLQVRRPPGLKRERNRSD